MRRGARTEAWRFAIAATLSAIAGMAAENAPPTEAPAAAEITKADGKTEAKDAVSKQPAPLPKPRPRLSPAIIAQLTSQLPVWSPPPPTNQTPAAAAPADPDVVPMKPVVVLGDRLPRIDDQQWLTPTARVDVLKKRYLSDFDRSFLNRFTLPLFGVSQEARAQMMYEEEKRLQDLQWMNDQVEQLKKLDPAEAKDLATIRDATFTRQTTP